MHQTNQTILTLIEEFQNHSHELITKIKHKKHQTLLLKKDTQQVQKENQLLQQENNQLHSMLQQFQNVLKNLESQNQQIISPDEQYWATNQQNAKNYHNTLLTQEQIINNSFMNLPNQSLDKLQQIFSEITKQKLVETIQSSQEKKIILQNLENTKSRFEKVEQKCRGGKSRSKNNRQSDIRK